MVNTMTIGQWLAAIIRLLAVSLTWDTVPVHLLRLLNEVIPRSTVSIRFHLCEFLPEKVEDVRQRCLLVILLHHKLNKCLYNISDMRTYRNLGNLRW
jgi:hypothetical protein